MIMYYLMILRLRFIMNLKFYEPRVITLPAIIVTKLYFRFDQKVVNLQTSVVRKKNRQFYLFLTLLTK